MQYSLSAQLGICYLKYFHEYILYFLKERNYILKLLHIL